MVLVHGLALIMDVANKFFVRSIWKDAHSNVRQPLRYCMFFAIKRHKFSKNKIFNLLFFETHFETKKNSEKNERWQRPTGTRNEFF